MTVCILRIISEHPMTVGLSSRSVSTERQQVLVLPLRQSKGWIVTSFQRKCIGHIYWKKGQRQTGCPNLEMTINSSSTIFGLPSWILTWLCNAINPSIQYQLPFWAEKLVIISLQCSKNEHQWLINAF